MTLARLGLATLLGLSGCGSGTALLVVVDASAVPGTEQIHVAGRAGGELLFGPAVRPERADGALDGPQTLRVLLPDSAAGQTLEVSVSALVGGAARGAGRVEVTAERGEEIRAEVTVEPIPAACLGCAGCCDGERCLSPSLAACGAGGAACYACDAKNADRCTDVGRCACGQGPSCDTVLGADRCQGGRCRCGDGLDPCGPGQECQNGLCRCTAASCAGCCDGNECLPGTTSVSCGSGGEACSACLSPQSCKSGACVSG